jgi:hypothetical protein
VLDALLVSLRRKGNSPISDGLYTLKISRPLRPYTLRRCHQRHGDLSQAGCKTYGPTRRTRKRRCQEAFGNSKTEYDITRQVPHTTLV